MNTLKSNILPIISFSLFCVSAVNAGMGSL